VTEFSDVCPKCGHEVEDLDGFGMLCDLGPGGCGWCSHPNITDGQCGFCGRMMEDRPSMDTLSRMGGCVRSAWRSSCAATAAHVQTKEG